MVCEICGSQSIRKENGVFVCQECGTEYSVEEAKKLLQEVEESTVENKEQTPAQNTSVSGKDKLLNSLSLWVLNLSKIPNLLFWFNMPNDCINTDKFWASDIINISSKKVAANFPKIDNSPLSLSQNAEGEGAFWCETFYYDDPAWNDFRRENPEHYEYSLKSLNTATRFYGKRCVISEIIEEEAYDESFQNKMTAFFSNYHDYSYGGSYLSSMFMSLIGKSYLVPGQGVVTERPNPKITELSVKYNSFFREDKGDRLCKTTGGVFKKTEYAPDSATKTFRALLKAGSDIVVEFIKKHNEMMDYCTEKYPEVCDLINDVRENCLKLESDLFIPYKYRSIPILLSLIDLVNDGKATTWQDLINLYDTHQYRIGVYERLDAINSKLDIIQNTLVVGFMAISQQLSEVNSNLQSMSARMDSINSNLKAIRTYDFITMWNSL